MFLPNYFSQLIDVINKLVLKLKNDSLFNYNTIIVNATFGY